MKRMCLIGALIAVLAMLMHVCFTSRAHAKPQAKAASKKRAPEAETHDKTPKRETAPPQAVPLDTPVDKAPVEEAKPTKGAKTKTYSFGGLDIDGRLRTPQLLYFLNRMKSEFDATAPKHRSFIPELKASPSEM